MRIALHDTDQNNFPNLALMKISAWHKKLGHKVQFFRNTSELSDIIYSSKVFSYSKTDPLLPNHVIKGGFGYGKKETLPDMIEHICPDYELYNLNYSLGFLTRGCSKKCSWCSVFEKEGLIRAHTDIEEFTRHGEVVLMDNNVLAHSHGIEQIEKIAQLGLKIDFNQGLDARLIDDGIARRLAACKWLKPVRLACDTIGHVKYVHKAVELLRWHNCTPTKFFVYVLVKDVSDAVERVKFLKGLNVDPFAQSYRDKKGTTPTKEQLRFCKWVNRKQLFKSSTWGDYKKNPVSV